MSGNSVALDTNQAIHVLNDVRPVVEWLNTFEAIDLPVTVLGEPRFGAMKPARPDANLEKIDRLAARCTVLETTTVTADTYARLRLDLHRKGRPIPGNDLWIAAACVERGVPLATDDAHFNGITQSVVMRRP